MRGGEDGGVLPTSDNASPSCSGVTTVKRLAAALLLAVAVFGLGQGGGLRSVGVAPATVAHACIDDACVVEAGAFITCMNNDACKNTVIIAAVAILGYMISPASTNQAIFDMLVAGYNSAAAGTKWALDSLVGTITNALSRNQAYITPSAAEKAGLQNLAISISAGQGVNLVEPGVSGSAGDYEFGPTSVGSTLILSAVVGAYGSVYSGTNLSVSTVQYGGAQVIIHLDWKFTNSSGTITQSGANTLTQWNCGSTCIHDDHWVASSMDHTGETFTGEFSYSSQTRHWGVGLAAFNSRYGAGGGTSTMDVGHQALTPLGTWQVNHDAGYFDRIGFSNTATPDPPSLGRGIGDQQIAIGAGAAVAGTGFIGSLINKTVHQGGGQSVGTVPTVTDAGGATVPIVQPTTQGATSTNAGIQLGVAGSTNGLLTGIEGTLGGVLTGVTGILTGTTTLTGVATGILTGVTSIFTAIGTFFTTMTTAVNRFFDLTVPLDTSSFRSNASLMSSAFPFSIPWDVARMTHLAFDVTPVTPSLSFSICLSGGHVSSSCSSPPTVSLAVLDPFIGFIRWAVLLMFVVGIAYGYRRLAGASV